MTDPHTFPRPRQIKMASSRNAAPALLRNLSTSKYVTVREAVASSPAADPDLLRSLAGDEKWQVRKRVARHPDTPTDVAAALLDDVDDRAADVAFRRTDLPQETYSRYVQSERVVQRAGAATRLADPSLLAVLVDDADRTVRSCVACNIRTSATDLWLLATDDEWYVRRDVAANPSSPPDLLDTLASDPEPRVRSCVAENETTTADVLSRMLYDTDNGVLNGVIRNDNTPAEAVTRAALDRSLVERDAEVWGDHMEEFGDRDSAATDDETHLAYAVLQYENTRPDLIDGVVRTFKSVRLRVRALDNPSTAPYTLLFLLGFFDATHRDMVDRLPQLHRWLNSLGANGWNDLFDGRWPAKSLAVAVAHPKAPHDRLTQMLSFKSTPKMVKAAILARDDADWS